MTRLARNWPPVVGDPYETAFLGDEEYTYVVRRRAELVRTALDRLAATYPPMAAYDQRQHDATVEDLSHVVDFLAAALYVDDAQVFTGFVEWTAAVLEARHVSPAALDVGLRLVCEQLRGFPSATAILGAGRSRLAR
ncbi:hypothetical protein [Couchioplanes caeruleus]|uniref:hypothetical protein n=1 Tax=Couchioplanes caeruleus TaxID=56438 RepID=UPI000AD11E06|nr:hypothetical protein [Couchioplanes caeruleus]